MEHHVNHSLHYGSGVFEWIRFYPTSQWVKIFRLKEHIERLFYSAKTMHLDFDYSIEAIIEACKDTVKKSGVESWYIRLMVYHDTWSMKLSAKNNINVTISVWKRWKYLSDDEVHVKISDFRRISPQTADMNAKVCGYYASNILASFGVKGEWYDEALLLDIDEFIAEWPWENIFFIKDDKVYTPQVWSILPWITRDTIIQLLDDQFNIKVIAKNIIPDDILDFDEAFFVWTAAEVTLIGSIVLQDGTRKDFQNRFSKEIKKIYQQIVSGEIQNYLKRCW